MSQNKKDFLTASGSEAAGTESPFVANAQTQVTAEDLFVGDVSFLRDLDDNVNVTTSFFHKPPVKTGFRTLYIIAAANILLTGVLAAVFWFSPASIVLTSKPIEVAGVSDSNLASLSVQPNNAASDVQADASTAAGTAEDLSEQEIEQSTEGVSLKLADSLVEQGELVKASYVYRQMMSNMSLGGTASEEFRDYLKLRIAACLQKADQAAGQDPYFTDALRSRSGLVRGLGYHYLALAHYQRGEYLQARKCAYQALSLIKTYQELVPANLEADLYFLAADSLTRYALSLHPTDQEMPGRLWSDSLEMAWPEDLDQQGLCIALEESARKLSEGAVGPKFQFDSHRSVGNQWSLVCLQSPAEEVLMKMSSQSGTGINWKTLDITVRSRPVTVYLPFVSEQYLSEVVAGSTGLVWKYDGQAASVFVPDRYDDFAQHRSSIVGETIAIWRRFLIRYRGEHRTPNAHYALGRMYALDQQFSTALAEYKVIQSHFGNNPLAPFAYLEASQIRTQIKDYFGAKSDLNEMLMLYPDCTAADKATLFLAEASFESNQIAEARELFGKVYQLNLSKNGRIQASFGLGRCAFLQKDWAAAKTWLSETLGQIEDKTDTRLTDICIMLGRALIELGENQQASVVLRIPLGGSLSDSDYVQIIQELVQAEVDQENYLEALNILESIPQSRLNQKDSCEALILKSKVLRAVDAAQSASALLRRKIEYIADSQLRAWLTLELAESYYAMEDYTQARRELNDVLADIQDKTRAQQAGLLLAKIAEKLDKPEQAEKICFTILANADLDPAIRSATFDLLGRIYTSQKAYDKAALIFAGVVPQQGGIQ